MVARVTVPAILVSLALLARADPVPSEPGPGQVFNTGAPCHVAWTPDPTGVWKTTNIQLMTGSNFAMVHLTTITTVDTTGSTTSFDFPCPAVTINAPIYFYQFTSPAAPNHTWTTRFTIADANGKTVPAPNAVEPDGSPIGWGIGALADPSTAEPAPAYLSSGGGSAAPSGPSGPSAANPPASSPPPTSSSAAPSSATPTGFSTSSAHPTSTASPNVNNNVGSNTSAPANTAPGGSQSDGALALEAVSSLALRGAVALAVIAGTFTFVL